MRHLISENTRRVTFMFVIAALILGSAIIEFRTDASSGAPAPERVERPQDPVTVRAVNFDNSWIKLQDARSLATTTYKDATERAAWDGNLNQSGGWFLKGAQPLSLAADDFDGNGFPDLVCGYATANGGVVSIRLGNPNSFAPEDPETLRGIGRHQFPDPFFRDVGYVQVLERPDFLGTVDFDRDGYMDIVAAARGGGALYFLAGDGHGGFSAPQRIALWGTVTAMLTGKIDQPDGTTSVVLGLNTPRGAEVIIYEGARNLLEVTSAVHQIPAPATSLALGRLDEDQFNDLAIVAGGRVLILHGRDQSQAGNGFADRMSGRIEVVPLSFTVQTLALGQFIWNRQTLPEMALLDQDGTVHIAARGELDTRPFTSEEMMQKRIALEQTRAEMEVARETGKTFIGSAAPESSEARSWSIAEDVSVPISRSTGAAADTASVSNAALPMLMGTRISTLPSDDLLIVNPAAGEFRIAYKESSRLNQAQPESQTSPRASVDLVSSSAPAAVLPMRVSVDGRPGLVVLTQDSSEPLSIFPDATTFHVTKTADTNDGVCNADCSLREAIVAANATAGADTIVFDLNGTFTLTITGSDNAAALGDLDINDSLTITGNGAANTIISTNYTTGCGDCKVFGINQDGSHMGLAVSFTGVTIQNGFNDFSTSCGVSFQETGGGVDFFLTGSGNAYSMTNCVITNNQAVGTSCASRHGGGVNVDSAFQAMPGGASAGTVAFIGCTFSNNTAQQVGAGLTLAADNHDVTMTDCAITGNTTQVLDGGGIWIRHSFGGTLNISGAMGSVSNNTSHTSGGGISVVGNEVANISNITISGNTSSGVGTSALGGGILIGTLGAAGVTGNTTLISLTISGNHADNGAAAAGGGIWFGGFYPATLTTCAISGNTSRDGAGVLNGGNTATPANTLVISGGSITGNVATNNGGAFASVGTGSPTASVTTFTNVTIGGTGVGQPNMAANGAGIADTQTGSVTITGGTISGNSASANGGGLLLQNTGTLTLNGVTVDSNSATAGSGLHQSGGIFTGQNTLSFNGGNSINLTGGTFNSTAGTLNLTGNFTRASAATFNHNNGTFNFNGSGAQNINGTATSETFNTFIVNKSGGTLAAGGSTTTITTGDLTMTAGSFTAPALLDINGNLTLNGDTLTAGTNITAAGNWTNNGGVFTPGANTVTFDGSGAQSINGTAASQTFNNFTIGKGGGTLSIGGSTTTLNVNGNFLLSGGTFAQSASALNVMGNLTVNAGTTFTKATGGEALTFNATGSQNWTDSTAAGQDFGNVVIGGSNNTVTMLTAMKMTALTVNSGDTLFLNGNNFAFSAAAAPTNNGTIRLVGIETLTNVNNFAISSGLVEYFGRNIAETLTIKDFGATDYFNLSINDTHGTKATFNLGGTLTVAGDLLLASGTFSPGAQAVNLSGNWTNNGGTFTPTGNTVNFNGAGAQTINGTAVSQTFNNIIMNKGGGTLSVGGGTTTLTLTGTLTLTAGTFNIGTANIINIGGDWINNATFTAGAGTVVFNGGVLQTIGGSTPTTFNNLTINNNSGVNLSQNETVTGLLTLTNGIVNTGANTLSLGAAATFTRTNGFVNGTLKKTFGANGAFTFPLGTPTGYSPLDVTVTFGAPADFTAKITQGPQPLLNPALTLQRYWTLTAAGLTANLVFHYVDGDVAGDESQYRIIRVSGGTSVGFPNACPGSPCVDTVNNSSTINNVSNFSDWTLGQQVAPTATNGDVAGRILDASGNPVAGAAVHLTGTQNRLTITDANGNYRFDNVDTNGFYTVTPARANYTFSPTQRSFSQLGQHTDAAFTASVNGGTVVNPLDTTEFFVRQQYLDFLNREPDEPGFTSWVNGLNNCAAGDPSCDRLHVSEMFFRSSEFQDRGYYIYRFYSTAFGRKPAYAEFTPDMAQVSGFLTTDQLEAAKMQFAIDFTNGPAFTAKYNGLSNAGYVDALINTAQVSLANRQTIIDALNNGAIDRAQALRIIAESSEVYAKYYNQAFVVMEYFGYLRRDPDALYADWIDVLNQTGDARHMVGGFVDSSEYRGRFPQ